MVSVVSSEKWAALSTMETECYLVSDFSDICHLHARSGECILMIFKLPRMIIRVVQMRCEKFRYFGELLIILKHPIVHRIVLDKATLLFRLGGVLPDGVADHSSSSHEN